MISSGYTPHTSMTPKIKLPFLFYLLLTFCLNLQAKEIQLPDLGARSSLSLSPLMEEKIARSVISQLQNSHGLIDDLELNNYLTELGYTIVEQSDDNLQPFYFYLLNSPQINAFATPGGVIAVNSGLFLHSQSESELASVLAHEIAHVTQRHLARAYEQANQLSLPMTIGLVAAILLGATGSADAGMAAATGLQAMTTQSQINFTRANEKEADRLGMQYLYRANFNPYGMAEFFQRLQQKNRYTNTSFPEFLRTHPVTTDRISEAMSRANQYQGKTMAVRSQIRYQLMKGKLKVLVDKNPQQLQNYYEKKIKKNDFSFVDQYIYAQILLKNNQIAQAIGIFEQLYQQHPQNLVFAHALAESLLASSYQKDNQQALLLLQTVLKQQPHHKVFSAQYADALIATGQIEKSIDFIRKYLEYYPKQAIFYQKLSTAYGKSGKKLKAHLALSEFYYYNGQYQQAMTQIRIARKYAKNDNYMISRLDSRLAEIKEEKQKFSLDSHL